MKKILVVNTKYRIFGGEDSNIKDEILFLKEKYDVEYLSFDNGQSLNFFDYLAFITRSNFKSNSILKKKIKEFSPDMTYVHNTWFKSNLGIFKVLEKEKILTVLKIHNFRFHCTHTFSSKKHFKDASFCSKCGLQNKKNILFNKYFENSILKSLLINWYGKKYFKILKESNIKLFVLNSFYKNYLENLGVSKSKIYISYNPINIEKYSNYNSNSDYVVYAGMLTEQKGLFELLRVWKEADNNLKLLVIGSGEVEDNLIEQYASPKLLFMGNLDNSKVLDLIKNSRAVITATKMFEGQPRLLCEASSFGVPSIYPSIGGIDEYFPKDYQYSFEQSNYLALQEKILFLEDKTTLNKESIRVQNHLKKIISESSNLAIIDEIIRES